MTQPTQAQQEMQAQAGKILTQVAGYVGVKAMEMGLRHGLFQEIANHAQGISASDLATRMNMDPLYTEVWCRSAYASDVLELSGADTFVLAPHMETLLLDESSPAYVGGLPTIMVQPEFMDRFADNLPTGERIWWDQCGPGLIQGVSRTARPFYARLIPGGFSQVPGLVDRLGQNARVMDLACGAGVGLIRMANTYPNITLVGVDGDAYSLGLTQDTINEAGLQDRISLVQSTFEDLDVNEEYDVVIINVSMHECRDIEKVTQNIYRALKPDGYFVISDFPFPETTEACRTVPARIMCGIQFFEAMIDDQLMPTQAFIDLLNKHGFRNVSAFDMAPVHAVTYGQK